MGNIEILEFDTTAIEKTEKVQERFMVTDLESSIWVFRKLAIVENKENEIKAAARKEIERIKAWEEIELKDIEKDKEYFEGLLTEYFIKEKIANPRFKLSTPFGKITSRKQQPKYEYDENKFISWAEQNDYGKLVRIKKEVNKKAAKEAFKVKGNQLINEVTGEVVGGVTVLERADSITVKVKK